MAILADRVEAVTFDSFSTLVDPHSAASRLEHLVDDPEAIARRWHPMAVRYATNANFFDEYETYFELHRDALDYLLRERGIERSSGELEELTSAYLELTPFDDVRDTFRRLAAADYRLGILSNGDPAMLDSLVAQTGIDSFVDQCISADEIRVYKPAARLYEHAVERIDVPIEAVVHVGAGWGDVQGCVSAGMQGVWVNRTGKPWPSFGPEPDLTVESLTAIADRLEA